MGKTLILSYWFDVIRFNIRKIVSNQYGKVIGLFCENKTESS
jgi:hypothetical protein